MATPCSIAAAGCAGSTSGFEVARLEARRVVFAPGLPRAIIRHDAALDGVAALETYGERLRYVGCTGPIRVMYGKLRVCRISPPICLLGARSSTSSSDSSSCTSHCRERSLRSDEQAGVRAPPGLTSGR